MLKEQKNSKKQGDVGVGFAIAYFMKNGYSVSIPVTESQEYDLIVEKDNILQRVEIKTTTQESEYDIPVVDLRTIGGNQSFNTAKSFIHSRCELLFVLHESKKMWLIPTNKFTNTRGINLGDKFKNFLVTL